MPGVYRDCGDDGRHFAAVSRNLSGSASQQVRGGLSVSSRF